MNPYRPPNSSVFSGTAQKSAVSYPRSFGSALIGIAAVFVLNFFALMGSGALLGISLTAAYESVAFIAPVITTGLVLVLHFGIQKLNVIHFVLYAVGCVSLVLFNRWFIEQIAASV